MNKDFAMPDGLDDLGQRAYMAIKKHLRDFEDMSTGGCKAFYSPTEWAERGESYGRGSKLIIVYDGGDLRPYMNMDACYEGHCMMMDFYQEMGVSGKSEPYGMYEKVREALRKEGLYIEECTGWYAAVYEG